jgi:hypothetical protein
MGKTDIKNIEQGQPIPGMRTGMDKKKLLNSLTDSDWKRIKLMKEADERLVKNEYAYKASVRSDQMFQQYIALGLHTQAILFETLSAKRTLDDNKSDILKGSTDKLFGQTGKVMSTRDLEIENTLADRKINEGVSRLWLMIADLYRYVGVQRLDRKVFYTEEAYTADVKVIENELKKNGITLFRD